MEVFTSGVLKVLLQYPQRVLRLDTIKWDIHQAHSAMY